MARIKRDGYKERPGSPDTYTVWEAEAAAARAKAKAQQVREETVREATNKAVREATDEATSWARIAAEREQAAIEATERAAKKAALEMAKTQQMPAFVQLHSAVQGGPALSGPTTTTTPTATPPVDPNAPTQPSMRRADRHHGIERKGSEIDALAFAGVVVLALVAGGYYITGKWSCKSGPPPTTMVATDSAGSEPTSTHTTAPHASELTTTTSATAPGASSDASVTASTVALPSIPTAVPIIDPTPAPTPTPATKADTADEKTSLPDISDIHSGSLEELAKKADKNNLPRFREMIGEKFTLLQNGRDPVAQILDVFRALAGKYSKEQTDKMLRHVAFIENVYQIGKYAALHPEEKNYRKVNAEILKIADPLYASIRAALEKNRPSERIDGFENKRDFRGGDKIIMADFQLLMELVCKGFAEELKDYPVFIEWDRAHPKGPGQEDPYIETDAAEGDAGTGLDLPGITNADAELAVIGAEPDPSVLFRSPVKAEPISLLEQKVAEEVAAVKAERETKRELDNDFKQLDRFSLSNGGYLAQVKEAKKSAQDIQANNDDIDAQYGELAARHGGLKEAGRKVKGLFAVIKSFFGFGDKAPKEPTPQQEMQVVADPFTAQTAPQPAEQEGFFAKAARKIRGWFGKKSVEPSETRTV